MAQLKVSTSDFTLTSPYICKMYRVEDYNRYREIILSMSSNQGVTVADKVSQIVRFDYAGLLPAGATIKSAKLYATLTASTYGDVVSTINGVHADPGNFEIEVSLGDNLAPIDVNFTFQSKNPEHKHEFEGEYHWMNSDMYTVDEDAEDANPGSQAFYYYEYRWNVDHEGSRKYKDVYLLIDYDPALDFSGWTDDPLVVGETFVKAVHMTELQQWTAVLSEYADNGTPTFTEAVPGETSLARWLSQVLEIRAVLDVISPNHETWIDVSVNCPRADVMTQLRKIIVAAM